MSPAFSSTRQAAAFGLMLLVLLLSPVLIPKSLLPPRGQVYARLPWNAGPFTFIHQQIFEEKSDIDIAIMGPSQAWCDIDTPYLQQEFSKKLGRQAVIVSLCWPWSGFDALYFFARDLLQHRKVRLLVFCDASGVMAVQPTPHELAWRWVRFAEDAPDLAGLPWRYQLQYYYGSILNLPRNLMALLRPDLPSVLTPEKIAANEAANHWIRPDKRLGSLAMQVGYPHRAETFQPFTPVTATRPSDFAIYSPQTADLFRVEQPVTPSLQIAFARKLAVLAREHGTVLANVNMPMLADARSPFIRERYSWPAAMQGAVVQFGIPPATLFEGMPVSDIEKLYWDPWHFNENGQKYYTRLLAPTLMQIYDDTAKN